MLELQGGLWYQARMPDGTAQWISCTAHIEAGMIRLISKDGSTPEQVVVLAACSDVRSLGSLDLPDQELPRLFLENGYRIFDVYLRPAGRERFAAVSVQQRAKWVSAIWSCIIDDRDRESTFSTYLNDRERTNAPFSDVDRGLPPVPQETPAMLTLSSPSVYAPTQMFSPRSYSAPRQAENLASSRRKAASNPQNASSPASVLSSPNAASQNLPPPDRSNLRRYSLSDVPSPSVATVAPPGLPEPSTTSDPLLINLVQQHTAEQRNQLTEVQRDLMNILPNLASLFESHGSLPQINDLLQLLAQLGNNVQGNHEEVKGILDRLLSQNERAEPRDVVQAFHNIGSCDDRQAAKPSPSLNVRLDALAASLDQMKAGGGTQALHGALNDQVAEMVELLRKGEVQDANHTTHQADVSRYLAELNGWMKSFSEVSLFHTNTALVKLDHLGGELGVRRPEDAPSNENTPSTGILNEIRESLEVLKARERHEFTPDLFMKLLENQRQEQEAMLRTLASDLSNEIKTERLSFVDAMSRATSFDIQAHLDQFKHELTKEVLSMTQEVGRLHLERQAVETQIADLFSFYNKHQAHQPAGMLSPPTQSTQMGGGFHPRSQPPVSGSRSAYVGPVRLAARDQHGRQLSEAPVPGQYVSQVRPQITPVQTDAGRRSRR